MANTKTLAERLANAERAFLKHHRAEMAADADPRCTTARHAQCIARTDAARRVRNELRELCAVTFTAV